jgi:hypothetical protein
MRFLVFLLIFASSAVAAGPVNNVTFEWDPVIDARVDHYVLGVAYRPASEGAVYTHEQISTVGTTAPYQIEGPSLHSTGQWYFAVKACNADESLCSAWSTEVVLAYQDGIPAPGNLRQTSVTLTFDL